MLPLLYLYDKCLILQGECIECFSAGNRTFVVLVDIVPGKMSALYINLKMFIYKESMNNCLGSKLNFTLYPSGSYPTMVTFHGQRDFIAEQKGELFILTDTDVTNVQYNEFR